MSRHPRQRKIMKRKFNKGHLSPMRSIVQSTFKVFEALQDVLDQVNERL